MLKNVPLFSANNVLRPIKDLRKYCKVMEYLDTSGNIFAITESQLQDINLAKLNNNAETEEFWSKVKEFKDASVENPFWKIF